MATLHDDEEYEMMQKEKSDLKFVFKILACQNPECVYYLIPPIQQCKRGHSFCAYCIWKETCPICFQTIIGTHCQALENIVSLLLVPCKNKAVGCDEVYPPGLKLDHEEQCIFNYVKCIHSGCSWRGERVNLWRHLTEVHPESMIPTDNLVIEVPLNITTTFVYHKILKSWGHYFGVKVSFDTYNNKLYGGVRQAGGDFLAGVAYSFSFSAFKAKAKHTYMYERQTYDSQRRFRFIFTSEDCFVVTKDFIDEFLPANPPSLELYLQLKRVDKAHTTLPTIAEIDKLAEIEDEKSTMNKKYEKTAKDQGGEKTAKDQGGERTAKDQGGEKTAKDKEGEKTAKDRGGEKTAKDKEGEKTAKDRGGEKTAKDKEGEKTAKDQEGDKTAKDQEGEKSTKGQKDEKSAEGQEDEKSSTSTFKSFLS